MAVDTIAMRQVHTMGQKYPQFRHYRNVHGNLIFTGILQPRKIMPVFKVSVEYRGGEPPRVWVIEPELIAGTPHIYPMYGNLCLYKPENFNWTAGKPIADSIIPWTSTWLYFYEVWKTKNIWLGPEATHDNTLKNE